MKFSEFPYRRPDIETVQAQAADAFARFEASDDFAGQWAATLEFVAVRREASANFEIAMVRHTIDTTDEFYVGEQEFADENTPKLTELSDRFYGLLLASPFRAEFEAKLGAHFFRTIEVKKRAFSPAIMDDLAAENKLITAYDKLLGGATVTFQGEEYTLSELAAFNEDADRDTRREAQEAAWGFFAANGDELDRLYGELVTVRHTMARTLGYDSFVQMGYDRLGRTGYGPDDVARFREGVLAHVVPQASAAFDAQRERLGLDALAYYDLPLKFTSGNPKPQGGEDWMKAQAKAMYAELAPEASELFDKLLDAETMDLSAKPGKQPGGYCTFLETMGLPFIFSNFNGTSGDVDVLTHEFGHALQSYSSRHHLLDEQRWPGMEAAEVHSMSMEYLTYPWMTDFFGPDAAKYHYAHQTGGLTFIPYGALVDAFQHWVYENPTASASERKNQWRVLERQYTPWVDYAGNAFLDAGGRWQRQGHLYWEAFYYIDYCLAQFAAMQVFLRAQDDRAAMWRDYLAMCGVGGTLDFVDMLGVGGLESPFDASVVGRTLDGISADIATIDASAL